MTTPDRPPITDDARAIARALRKRVLLATARTRPTRDDLILALARADGQAWPDGMDDHTANHMYGKQADAVLALLGGGDRG